MNYSFCKFCSFAFEMINAFLTGKKRKASCWVIQSLLHWTNFYVCKHTVSDKQMYKDIKNGKQIPMSVLSVSSATAITTIQHSLRNFMISVIATLCVWLWSIWEMTFKLLLNSSLWETVKITTLLQFYEKEYKTVVIVSFNFQINTKAQDKTFKNYISVFDVQQWKVRAHHRNSICINFLAHSYF